MKPASRNLAHWTWQEIRDLDKDPGVLVLPIGAVEQHGPHLPVLTDTLIAATVLDAALQLLPLDVRVWALPPLPYSKSNEHSGFAGTFGLSMTTLTALLHDLARGAVDAGFHRLAFFNGHGGNVAVLDAAARDIRAATGLLCFCIHPAAYLAPPFAIDPDEERYGFHAGEVETSLLLHIEPELVHPARAVRHLPAFPANDSGLFFFGPASAAWLSKDWSPSGVFGDATKGTADKGQMLLDAAAIRVAELLAYISTFTLPSK